MVGDEPAPGSVDAFADNGFLFMMLVVNFRNRSKVPFRTALSTLVTKDNLTRHLVTSLSLQKFSSQIILIQNKAIVVVPSKTKVKWSGRAPV